MAYNWKTGLGGAGAGAATGAQLGSFFPGIGTGIGAAAGGALGFLGGFGENPAQAADQYYQQVPGQLHQGYDPYVQQGQQQMGQIGNQYSQLQNDPSARLNQIGSGYKQSPGYQFALQQALQGGQHAHAAGGMAGSPAHEQWAMQTASGLASQDYDKWLTHALGLYDTGLSGGQHLSDTGYNASDALTKALAENTENRGKLAYGNEQQENQNLGDLVGGAGGSLAAFYNLQHPNPQGYGPLRQTYNRGY